MISQEVQQHTEHKEEWEEKSRLKCLLLHKKYDPQNIKVTNKRKKNHQIIGKETDKLLPIKKSRKN